MVDREGRHERVGPGQRRAREVAGHQIGAPAEAAGGQREDVGVRIDADHSGPSDTVQAAGGQRSSPDAEVHDGGGGRWHDGGRRVEHFLVIRDERANPLIVFPKLNAEVGGHAHEANGS